MHEIKELDFEDLKMFHLTKVCKILMNKINEIILAINDGEN